MTAAVLDRIRAGEFRPGDRLPTEKGLMAEYGVGRNAAREAVQALVAMGLVDVRPGRGATVLAVEAGAMDSATVAALLQDHTVDHLYEFRRLLEVEIARRAAERASEDDIEELEDVLARFCRAYERGRRTDAIDDEFHAALAAASHNPVYSTVLDAVGDLISSARRLASSVPWAVERALTEHDELLAAVADHDPTRRPTSWAAISTARSRRSARAGARSRARTATRRPRTPPPSPER